MSYTNIGALTPKRLGTSITMLTTDDPLLP